MLQHLRFALRQLRKTPEFALARSESFENEWPIT
jgi:hypothetical protein